MTHNANPDPAKPTPQASANEMDRPLPGSDGPVPAPDASGVAEPIEAVERASGVSPGNPSPTEQAQTPKPGQPERP